MNRIIILIGLALSCILTALANVVVERVVGINIFSFKVWFIVPIGAVCVGALAGLGGMLAARLFNIVPNWFDAISMVVCAAFAMFLIYYIDYSTLVLDDGRKVSDLVGFNDYVNLVLTETHMRVGRGAHDTGKVGEFGYVLAVANFIGFLVGGLGIFFISKGMERCTNCDVYLRKVKTTDSGQVTIDEAERLLHLFRNGSFEEMESIVSWQAPKNRTFEKTAKRAMLQYTLHACPKCKDERITETAKIYNGSDWKDVAELKCTREIVGGLSLREAISRPKLGA